MKTTASQLLALVFEGHSIRTVIQDGKPLFVAKDVLNAAEIAATRNAYQRLKDYERVLTPLNTLGGKQTMVCLTESGVYHVLFSSQKPAAEKLRRWLADEVLPQLLTYGSYLPGSTPAERLAHLHRRWRIERATLLAAGQAALAPETGLTTLRAFRLENCIPLRDVPAFSRRVQHLARLEAITLEKLILPRTKRGGPTNAWPRTLLATAASTIQPRLF